MRSIIFFLTMIAVCLLTARYCLAEIPWQEKSKRFCDEYGINYQKAKDFANKLNSLVKADDKKSIAKMIHYPVEITKSKKSGERIVMYIEDEKEFLEQYHSLFNKKIKANLEEDRHVICGSLGGAGTAGGGFWFSNFDEGLKIDSINTPNNY